MNCAPASSAPESTSGTISVIFMLRQSARQQPKTQDEKGSVNGGAAGQPDPDADRAERHPEGECAGAGKSDQPVADHREQQRYPRVVHAAKRTGSYGLDTVGDKKRRADQQKRRG